MNTTGKIFGGFWGSCLEALEITFRGFWGQFSKDPNFNPWSDLIAVPNRKTLRGLWELSSEDFEDIPKKILTTIFDGFCGQYSENSEILRSINRGYWEQSSEYSEDNPQSILRVILIESWRQFSDGSEDKSQRFLKTIFWRFWWLIGVWGKSPEGSEDNPQSVLRTMLRGFWEQSSVDPENNFLKVLRQSS